MAKTGNRPPSHQMLTVVKMKSVGHLFAAFEHNLRDYTEEQGFPAHVDPLRTPMNVIIRGPASAKEAMALERRLLAESESCRKNHDGTTRKTRTDAVRAIEFMASVPVDFAFDDVRYFNDVVAFLEQRFDVPVLSAVIHRDEGAPHLHCVVLPLRRGRLVGSDMVGAYDKLHSAFFDQVASRYGFVRKVKLHPATSTAVAESAMHAIDLNPELLLAPGFKEWLFRSLKRDADAIMALFGWDVPRAQKDWVATMTRPAGRGRRSEKCSKNHQCQRTADDASAQRQKITLSCDKVIFLGRAESPIDSVVPAVIPRRKPHLTLVSSPAPFSRDEVMMEGVSGGSPIGDRCDEDTDVVVEREDEMPAAWWDCQRGEFIKPDKQASPSNPPA